MQIVQQSKPDIRKRQINLWLTSELDEQLTNVQAECAKYQKISGQDILRQAIKTGLDKIMADLKKHNQPGAQN